MVSLTFASHIFFGFLDRLNAGPSVFLDRLHGSQFILDALGIPDPIPGPERNMIPMVKTHHMTIADAGVAVFDGAVHEGFRSGFINPDPG